LQTELEKERLRLEFAHLAGEFTRWTRDTIESAEVTNFGFTLEEVEKFGPVLHKADQDVIHLANEKKDAYDHVWKKLGEMGVTQNIYTPSTPNTLATARVSLDSAVADRQKKYFAELSRQKANDALCHDFAVLSDPFSKWISEQKEIVSKSKLELEPQLKFVDERLSSIPSDSAKLTAIKNVSAKVDAAGITNNRHTTLTLKDIEVQWEQYQVFLAKKKKMLEEEIEHSKLRGVTVEQLNEIKDTFSQFDVNKSGDIDRKELKACLYSLGEDKTNLEVAEILGKFGKGGTIPYEGFKEFMLGLLGDSDTKEEILNGFKLINKGGDVALVNLLNLVMKDYDLKYFEQTAPKSGQGYNYHHWTEEVFSR